MGAEDVVSSINTDLAKGETDRRLTI
jgi:hypothetical protein